jgi:ferric-dicitrate binding protein FerR (iron transport regulator)
LDNSLLFATLFRKYLDNNCSPAEVDQLMELLKDEAYKQQANEMIEQQLAVQKNMLPVDGEVGERLSLRLQSILEAETPAEQPTHYFRRNRWWLAAAAILLLLGAGTFMWWGRSTIPPKPPVVQEQPKNQIQNDVLPGGNKALLTLDNGTTIILDSAHTGALAQQGNTQVTKLNDGQLLYNQTVKNGTSPLTTDNSQLTYNTLSTPRGGQYQLVLPDGSTVWLNAASSIRFPTAFTGNERNVEITGEAYFEVKKNAAMPFTVKMNNGAAVKVLGTHFNINAYDDELESKVTLLEGRVEVGSGQWAVGSGEKAKDKWQRAENEEKSVVLKPGEQAVLLGTHSPFTIDHSPDLEQVMAWKNGAFQFNGATIETVMRQVSRWYDVEVEYKGKISLHFAGAISRNVHISQVLEMLEKAGGIKTSITGKKVIVSP